MCIRDRTGTDRAFGFVVVLGVVVFYVTSMVVLTLANAAFTWFGWQGERVWLTWLAESGLTLLLSVLAVACLLRFMPPVKVAWRHVWGPALACALAFVILKFAFTLYVTYVAPTNSTGALGAVLTVVIFLFSMGMIYFVATEMVKLNWKRDQKPPPIAAVAAALPPATG